MHAGKCSFYIGSHVPSKIWAGYISKEKKILEPDDNQERPLSLWCQDGA